MTPYGMNHDGVFQSLSSNSPATFMKLKLPNSETHYQRYNSS